MASDGHGGARPSPSSISHRSPAKAARAQDSSQAGTQRRQGSRQSGLLWQTGRSERTVKSAADASAPLTGWPLASRSSTVIHCTVPAATVLSALGPTTRLSSGEMLCNRRRLPSPDVTAQVNTKLLSQIMRLSGPDSLLWLCEISQRSRQHHSAIRHRAMAPGPGAGAVPILCCHNQVPVLFEEIGSLAT